MLNVMYLRACLQFYKYFVRRVIGRGHLTVFRCLDLERERNVFYRNDIYLNYTHLLVTVTVHLLEATLNTLWALY